MELISEPETLDSLVKLFPLCKRVLLNTPWDIREITGTQKMALLTLSRHRALTMTHLADAIACSKEQATRAVAPLVKQGYLQRFYDRSNRTRVFIRLTPVGQAAVRREYAAVAGQLRDLFSALPPEDRAELHNALNTVSRLLARAEPETMEP